MLQNPRIIQGQSKICKMSTKSIVFLTPLIPSNHKLSIIFTVKCIYLFIKTQFRNLWKQCYLYSTSEDPVIMKKNCRTMHQQQLMPTPLFRFFLVIIRSVRKSCYWNPSYLCVSHDLTYVEKPGMKTPPTAAEILPTRHTVLQYSDISHCLITTKLASPLENMRSVPDFNLQEHCPNGGWDTAEKVHWLLRKVPTILHHTHTYRVCRECV